MTVVAVLGGWSALLILSNKNNIKPDFGNIEFTFDVNLTVGDVENVNFSMPINLNNTGYFDIENLVLSLQIAINYSHVNWGGPGVNVTRSVIVLNQSQGFGDILKGTTKTIDISGYNSSFIHENFPSLLTEVNWFRSPNPVEFYANFTISLDYSLGMHSLAITIINIPVKTYSIFP